MPRISPDLRTLVEAARMFPPDPADSLADVLYERLYTRAVGEPPRRLDPLDRRRHVVRLSDANCGRGTWEPGWTIRGTLDDGRVEVEKDGLSLWTPPEGLRPAEAPPGTRCRVRVGKELRELLPGFYIAIGDGDAGTSDEDDERLVRFYWHLTAEGSVGFLRTLTASLNGHGGARLRRDGVAFRAKVLSHPRTYRRADAGVLYLARRHYDDVAEVVAEIWREVRHELRPEVPLLTRELAPGLAVAEDPGDARSFGQHRCELVAKALERASAAGRDALDEVAAVFQEAGLDPLRPYLDAGSEDVYRVLDPLPEPAMAVPASVPDVPKLGLPETAARTGDGLCRDAFWHEDRCNWIGHVLPADELQLPVAASLGGDLYDGTAGVALFLAQLYAATGDERHRRTAAGALRHACRAEGAPRHTLRSDQRGRLGFYVGRLGIACAGRRIARLLGSEDLLAASERRLAELTAEVAGEPTHDVLSGNAGAVLALLALHRETADERFLHAAVTLGDELCEAVHKLTGLAHGAAGPGLALLELAAVTGRELYRTRAAAAFAYEDGLFNEERGNWPDLRPEAHGYAVAWCHGAPGIALSRLRALDLDPTNDGYRDAARAGARTTLTELERAVASEGDTSLCHGAAGLVDVLLEAGRVLGDESYRGAARRAAEALVARYAASGEWPSGVPSRGKNPSLMLGEAGVGYTLLRLCEPEVPSVLLPDLFQGSPQKGVDNRR